MDVEKRNNNWTQLSQEKKKEYLFLKQKELLEAFLERGAISKAQFDKSLGDLTEKMGMQKYNDLYANQRETFEESDDLSEKTMVIFMGLQGSGKTFYYHQHFDGDYEHVNLDELHTRNKENLLIKKLISEGKNFVVDNTNPQIEDRQRYIKIGKDAGYRIIGYFFESKIQDCIRRNNLREGKAKLPAKAIAATSNKLQIPTKAEGFDELYFIERNGETEMLRRDWRD